MLVVVDRNGSVVHRAKHVDAETLGVIRKLLSNP
jgi:sulfur carrier protein ThiS